MDEGTSVEQRFTLEEYIDYLQAPQWVRDGFDSEAEYKAKWCSKVMDWYNQSQEDSKGYRDVWDRCYKALTRPSMQTASSDPRFEDNISSGRIALLKSECLAEVSALYANDYLPALTPLQDSAKPMVSMGNQYMSQEFALNGWRAKKFTLGVDAYCTDMWIVKTNTSNDAPGPYGQEFRITIDRINPLNFFPDMKAACLDWNRMDFMIVCDTMDLGVVRDRFKDKAKDITEALLSPIKDQNRKYSNAELVTLPGFRDSARTATDRLQVELKECWLHDERYEFKGDSYIDEEDGKTKYLMDESGYVVGGWQKAYPHGRMIVTAADREILRDVPNPFWHEEAPFVICRHDPDFGGTILGVGVAADILGIDRKVNDIESRSHSYLQSEIERPMVADEGALPSNIAWYQTTSRSRAILLKRAGTQFARPAPVELPASVQQYLNRLDGWTQKTSGRPAIMQGQLQEGANLSAEAVQSVQGYGASVYGMKAIFIAEANRKLGVQVFELIRETYPENLSADITMPDGSIKKIEWNSKELDTGYFVQVDLASNAPGGKEASNKNTLHLYEIGLVDDIYTLQNLGVDGYQDIIKRKQAKKEQEIYTQAAGRAAGLQVKSITKQNEQPGPVRAL